MKLSFFILLVFFKVRNYWFSVWVLEIQHIILVLVIKSNAVRLKSILFSNVVSVLAMLLSLLFHLFHVLSFLSSLSFNPLMFLNLRQITIGILLFIDDWMSCRFKCTNTKFVFTWALKCFVLNCFAFWFTFISFFRIIFSIVLNNNSVFVFDNNMSISSKFFVINVELALKLIHLIGCAFAFIQWFYHLFFVGCCNCWLMASVMYTLISTISHWMLVDNRDVWYVLLLNCFYTLCVCLQLNRLSRLLLFCYCFNLLTHVLVFQSLL